MSLRPAPRKGVYEDEFWRWLALGELRMQRCTDCGRFRYPPGPSCPECLGEEFDWAPLSGRGSLLSWAVFRRQYFPSLAVPYTVVAVETAEGPIMVGGIDEPAAALRIGAPVTVWYEQTRTTEDEPITLPQWRLAAADA